ncbi:MAG: hypothetical protein WEB58_13355 [Planctomycetaceae bacterium]
MGTTQKQLDDFYAFAMARLDNDPNISIKALVLSWSITNQPSEELAGSAAKVQTACESEAGEERQPTTEILRKTCDPLGPKIDSDETE